MSSQAAQSPRRRRNGVVLVAALVTIVLTAWLGVWQLDRAGQKQRLQQVLDTRSALPPLRPEELAADPDAAAAQYQRRVRLRGQWLAEATVYLDNRQMNGRAGFFVLTPLQLDTGSRPLVWIQRGWIVRDNDQRTRLAPVRTPGGVVEISGRVAPSPARLFEFAADAAGPIRQNLDLAASAVELGRPVLPLTVVETDPPDTGGDGLARDWPAPAVDIHKHHGYAFQWFALSALVAGLTVWFQLIRRRRPHP